MSDALYIMELTDEQQRRIERAGLVDAEPMGVYARYRRRLDVQRAYEATLAKMKERP